jgi:hypothetical protein
MGANTSLKANYNTTLMEGFGMNTSPGSPYANDTDISGNETD